MQVDYALFSSDLHLDFRHKSRTLYTSVMMDFYAPSGRKLSPSHPLFPASYESRGSNQYYSRSCCKVFGQQPFTKFLSYPCIYIRLRFVLAIDLKQTVIFVLAGRRDQRTRTTTPRGVSNRVISKVELDANAFTYVYYLRLASPSVKYARGSFGGL